MKIRRRDVAPRFARALQRPYVLRPAFFTSVFAASRLSGRDCPAWPQGPSPALTARASPNPGECRYRRPSSYGKCASGETEGRRGAVTARVGILGTISSASGKAAGETGDYPGPPGAPRKARPVPPGAMVVSGCPARQEAGDLATSSEFPRVHLMTPPARARQNDRGIVRLDTFRGRRRRGRLRHRKVGTFRRGGSPHGTGATREVTGLRGS